MKNTFPVYPEDITPLFLSVLISELHPGTTVTDVKLLDAKGFGETNISTSSRVTLQLTYNENPQGLPRYAVAKMLKTDDWPSHNRQTEAGARQRPPRLPIYENEVNLYVNLGKELPVQAPVPIGARYDPAENRYILLLEDLSQRDAYFPTQFDEVTEAAAFDMVAYLARLHAAYWETPRFKLDLAWLQTPAKGSVADCINGPVRKSVFDEVERYKFKQEILGRIGTTPAELFGNMALLHDHQARLPSTLIHGDAHFGNTYRLPDETIGFLDWQLAARGFGMRDVAYLVVTMLSIAQRRKLERDLINYYGEQLRVHGVIVPSGKDFLWTEYRRAMLWCVAIGWMPCPPEAYGWELVVIANNRTTTAYEDLETGKAVQAVSR